VSQRVFLHPGPLKTGTTYLQSLLYANRASFRAQGVTIVGDQGSHHRAANELMRRKGRLTSRVPRGAWKRTRAEVLRSPGDAVMSCERYSLFGVKHVRGLLEDLPNRELHAVLTLRDPAAVVPARWQEAIKNGGTATWADFQERIIDEPGRMQRTTRAIPTLENWAALLPAERVHVVTVPPKGAPPTLLLERFCEVIGADPAGLETLEARANPSMDPVTTELIRRVNAQDTVRLTGRAQHFEIKTFLASEMAGHNRGKPELSAAVVEAAKAESQALIERIENGGFHVVGDLNDLVSSAASAPSGSAVDVNPEELLDRAAVAIATLAQRSWERGQQLRNHDAPRRARARRLLGEGWRTLRPR
jgi:hypothetical protein